jgi:glutathione S-transferase
VLEIEPGRYLAESNAILFYLAQGTPFLPKVKIEQALTLQWLFFEQYSHEPYIALSRSIRLKGLAEQERPKLQEKRGPAMAALARMDLHLQKHDFFVGKKYSIADIALYAYTHVAEEGGFALAEYPSIVRWLERVQAQPKHVTIAPFPAAP